MTRHIRPSCPLTLPLTRSAILTLPKTPFDINTLLAQILRSPFSDVMPYRENKRPAEKPFQTLGRRLLHPNGRNFRQPPRAVLPSKSSHLRKTNQSLEQRVAERTAQLEQANLSLRQREQNHKRAEQLLQRANRTLQAIRDCHEAMLRADTERDLLDQICRIIVRTGGERMVWVGIAEHDTRRTVRPEAAAGRLKDYLSRARITWADTPRGRGPVGTAIRTGKVCVCHDTLTDPQFAPWREAARRQKYGSVIALPLHMDGKCIGALCLYGAQPNMFDKAEQLLLEDLANDLAFGISMLRLRAERDRLEDEILKSIEHEQERISRDLHDGLCQLLVGAKYRSVYLKRLAKGHLPAMETEAQSLEELLNGAIGQARELARGLNPVTAAPAGLTAALQKLAADAGNPPSHGCGATGGEGPRCFCQFPRPVKIFDQHIACHLYRIAQEAVQNAFKHSRAKNISITLSRHNKLVNLVVKDDGIGIRPHPGETGMGLKNMQTRARLIGGLLEIRRRKHGGTAVTCQFLQKPQP
jgi:signal transduction histidine kinase